jgi:S-adenosylmethionine hydrolase
MNPPIVILTDFGTRDPFVGIMKGVILRINPQASLIDLSNHIPPGDVRQAAITLWSATPFFPQGSIFLTVVDPGVGTYRKPIILQTSQFTFIGPDNGVFSYVSKMEDPAWELQNPIFSLPSPGTTFHGRDIFAPAAAHASLGIKAQEFGPVISRTIGLEWPNLEVTEREIIGEVLYVDHFGNILTSLGVFKPMRDPTYRLKPWISGQKKSFIDLQNAKLVLPNQQEIPWARTFGLIPGGQIAFILGSTGLLEIAANRANASSFLALKRGDPLILRLNRMPSA